MSVDKNIKLSGSLFGGNKNSSKTPSQANVTSASSSKITVLELISHGPCEGLINGNKSIYLDNTPVQNADGSLNFQGLVTDSRRGTVDQTYMPGFADTVASTTNVGTEVKNVNPVTKLIKNPNIDGIRVKLSFQLQTIKQDNGTANNSVAFTIWLKQGGGAFVAVYQENKTGYLPSSTEFDYFFPVNNANGTISDFQFKITKDTPDAIASTGTYNANASNSNIKVITLVSFAECIQQKLSYPFSGLVGLQLDSRYFSSPPTRSYDWGGYLCLIPTNAVVASDGGLNISGTWNGQFYQPTKAPSDPAWQLYALLTNKDWGLGEYLAETNVDKWALYSISVYNNQAIADGLGGIERRYRCNTVVTGKNDAWQLINSLCSSMAVKPFWDGITISFWQDRPSDPVMQFTQADVDDETWFTYTSTPLRSRKSVIIAQYNEPAINYQQTQIRVEDPDNIARYGIRETELVVYGCTSQGQATRVSRNALISDRIQTETVSFKARAIAAGLKPGQVFTVTDSARAGVRYGGLIKAATLSQVTIDFPVNASGQISVLLSSGVVETRNIASINGLTVNVSPNFSSVPSVESNWVISASDVKPQYFRCISNVRDNADPNFNEITGITYRGDKYNAIEQGWSLEVQPTKQTVPVIVNKPRNIGGKLTGTSLTVKWDYPLLNNDRDIFTSSYVVQYAPGGSNGIYNDASTTSTQDLTLMYTNLPPDNYGVRVAAVQVDGKVSDWVYGVIAPLASPLVQQMSIPTYFNDL